ncbi:Cytochrome P450 [Phytophthora cinnamomi]|uniref:Cytochrome P450 n=1 Tax=Phytophthora cinnamomi TaxID=4785 RepID=UPI00355A6A29|nr:Cytochrome P450 [Phytophthora cinnamomi]
MGGSSASSSSSSSALWVALPAAAAAAALVYLLVPDERQRAIRRLPAPASTLPVLGNTLDLMSLELPRLHDWIAEQCKAFGGRTWRLQVLGAPPLVVVSSVEAFEDVLKTQFEVFDKGERMNAIFRDMVGGGIAAVDGPQWLAQRKMLSRLFTMRAFRETISQCVHDYTLVLGRLLGDAARTGAPVDLADVMQRFAFDVFTDIAFGLQGNALEGGEHTEFMEAMARIMHNLELRFHSPDWLWKLKRALKLGSEKELAQEVAILDKMVFTIINKNMERKFNPDAAAAEWPPRPQRSTKDVVSLFLDAHDEQKTSGEDAATPLDASFLRDVAVVVLLAGKDTTALSMSWLIIMLNRNPKVETKLRQELREKLPRLFSDPSFVPTMDDVEGLVYLEAVLRESLRLNPVVPLNAKEANRDTTLVDGTFVKKGTRVYIPSYTLGRMKSVWGRDASKFKPERWLMQDPWTGELTIRPVSAFQFVSFHAGPRTCLGMRFAMLEMKTVMAYMLSKYHFTTRENPKSYTYDVSSLLQIKGPLICKVQRAG